MSNKPSQSIKDKLDQAEDQLSSEVLDDLRASRRYVLDQLNKPNTFFNAPSLKMVLPVGGFATAASLALMVSFFAADNQPEGIGLPLAEADMLVLTEDLSLIEDLSFYDWVLTNEVTEKES